MKFTPLLLLAVLALTGIQGLSSEEAREACLFRATVVPVSNEGRMAAPTNFHARFVLGLRVEEFIMGSPLVEVGDEKVFAIHSLFLMFPEDSPGMTTERIEGRSYLFFLSRTTWKDGGASDSLCRGEIVYEEFLKNKRSDADSVNSDL